MKALIDRFDYFIMDGMHITLNDILYDRDLEHILETGQTDGQYMYLCL